MKNIPKSLTFFGGAWILILLLGIIFKMKVFIELFPLIGVVFIFSLLIYTIYYFVTHEEEID